MSTYVPAKKFQATVQVLQCTDDEKAKVSGVVSNGLGDDGAVAFMGSWVLMPDASWELHATDPAVLVLAKYAAEH